MWNRFIKTFMDHTIRAWSAMMEAEWMEILISRGIYVETDIKWARKVLVTYVLYRPI